MIPRAAAHRVTNITANLNASGARSIFYHSHKRFTGFVGLRVVIRKANKGHFGTGQNGCATRVSAIFSPGTPFEISYFDADGAVAIVIGHIA
jgi:hypothetical protein